jgi:hypothetical protein
MVKKLVKRINCRSGNSFRFEIFFRTHLLLTKSVVKKSLGIRVERPLSAAVHAPGSASRFFDSLYSFILAA